MAAAWYLDHKLVAALRVDQRARVIDATAGLSELLGVDVAVLTGIELSAFCETYLDGSTDSAELWHLPHDDEAGVGARFIDDQGRVRQLRIHAGSSDGQAQTFLFSDTTALASAQSNLERRMAHDRLLHLLVNDLLDESTRDPELVVLDALAGFADYFDLLTAALTTTSTGAPQVISYVSNAGIDRTTFDRLGAELQLFEAPDVDQLLDTRGPGDVWHIPLDDDYSYALGVEHRTLTCMQVTVPYHEGEELSFLATLGGKLTPPKADLELGHKALSHLAQYLRRASAEERIRRHSALDEALATTRLQLLDASQGNILETLKIPVGRIAAITGCTDVELRPRSAVDSSLVRAFGSSVSPRPVAPESLGLDPTTSNTWALPISDGHDVIAMLSYVQADPRHESDTANAWQRLAELVPDTSARVGTERRLEVAFHNAPTGIAVRDADGRLTDCNEAFVQFVGAANAQELIGSHRVALLETSAIGDVTADAIWQGVELPFSQPDGGIAWGRVTTTTVEEASGATVVLDHIEDITSQRGRPAAITANRGNDSLTGLPTRIQIEQDLETRLAKNEPVTVTSIDLDHFSAINASLGHLAGDRLLQLAAGRLQLIVGSRSALARAGGDEFIVVAPTASQQRGRDLADRILSSLRQPFDIDGSEILTGASVGVVIARGQTTASELLLAASEALAEAKAAGRNRVVHRQSSGERRQVGLFESELRRAVHERSLEVYYQPEFDVESRFIVGAEALVRWQHPTEGLLPAGAFVPLIEEIGLSNELCDYVLEDACRAAVQWRRQVSPAPFKIRVNLSPRDMEHPDIVSRVMSTVDKTGLPTKALCLEITETTVMRDQRRVVQHLEQFAELGISLAIDDFGTGFSSLWLLRELPFDTLKIDQAFIKTLDSGLKQDRAIVETIVQLGETLGMEITAEGVETEAQFEMLRKIGIKRAQGFLLAEPEPKSKLAKNLHQPPS